MVVLTNIGLATVLEICLSDYGFLVQRNFSETSHTKGEQDAPGATVKQKVSQTAVIRNGKDMKEYLKGNFATSAATTFACPYRR